MQLVSASTPSFDDWDGVHQAVATAYFPHVMKPLSAGPACASHLEVVHLGPCRITHIALGATVAVDTDHPGAYAVNAPLRGSLTTRIGGRTLTAEAGQATVCPPDTPVRLPSWATSCRLLGFRIEKEALDVEYERVLARRARELPSHLDLRTDCGQDWIALVESTFARVHSSSSALFRDPRMASQLSGLLITGFLLAATPDERADSRGTRPRIVRRVMDALQTDPARPWTPGEMAEIAGVGVRRLQQGFREYLGQTPSQYLRALRLDCAHLELLSGGEGVTVGEVAMRWGLHHPGRFAADYRRRFGQSPSRTLAG